MKSLTDKLTDKLGDKRKAQLIDYGSSNRVLMISSTELVSKKGEIGNRGILDLCRNVGNIFGGTTDSHLCHKIGEMDLSLLIKRH